MNAQFSHKVQLSPGVWEFYFTPASALDYQPGQYVDIRLPKSADARSTGRVFTLTSLPTDKYISFAVKFPNPHTVYKQDLLNLTQGDSIEVSQAMGDLVLPRDVQRPLVFVAGGLGIASFVSIMKWLTLRDEPRNIRLLYAHKPAEVLFTEIITRCPGIELEQFASPTRITALDIMREQAKDTLFYISGSESFTVSLRNQLLSEQRVPSGNIAYDYFDGYQTADF